MENYDGSVRLSVNVDTTDFNKGTNTINKGLGSLKSSLSSLGVVIAATFSGDKTAILQNNLQKSTAELENQKQKVDELKSRLDSLKNGSATFENKSVKKLQADLDKATASAEKTKEEIDSLYTQLDTMQMNAFKNPETGEPVFTGKELKDYNAANEKLDELEIQLSKDRQKADELRESLKNAMGIATQNEITKTQAKLKQAESKLSNLSLKAKSAEERLKNSINPLNKVSDGFKKLGKRIGRLFASVFIFSVISKALRELLNIIKSVSLSNQNFQKSWYELQAALWVAVTPLLDVAIPALQRLVEWTTVAITAVTKLMVALSGKSYSDITKRAKQLKKQSDSYNDISKSSKKAAKSVAAFDEVNTLSQKDSADDEVGFKGANADKAFENLDNSQEKQISDTIANLLKVIAGALIVIGVILLFTGHIGWGVGFIIAGAGVFAVAAQSVSEKDPTETPKRQLQQFLGVLGGMMLVIGVLLCCFGVALPLSIGLIIAGVATLTAAVALDANYVKNQITKFFKDNMGIIAGVSVALIVIGIILICTGVGIGFGIGMILAGAASLVATVALNYNAIKDKITNFFKENSDIIAGVSLALLVLGVILLVTGVGIPIGLGLILAGCVGLAGVASSNEDFIPNKLKEVWKKVQSFWNKNIAPVLTKEWWLKLAKNIGNGFISGIEGMINGVISMFEKMINWIVGGLNKISFDVPDWVPGIGGKKFGFNLSKVNFGRVSIPRLATGAVIPPNREFLAILGDQKRGTNIEAPLDTIKQAVAEVISQINVNNKGFSGTIVVPVTVNGREILRVVREAENELGKQTVYGGFANAY